MKARQAFHCCVVGACLVVSACTGLRVETVADVLQERQRIEQETMERLSLYPASLEYKLVVLDSIEAVQEEAEQDYHSELKAPGYYNARAKRIVVSKDSPVNVLRHEIGHAIVDQYFKQPVPRWLHEAIARQAETKD